MVEPDSRPSLPAEHLQPLCRQTRFEFDDDPEVTPQWVAVNARVVRVENLRQFGGPWIALHLIRTLGLDRFLRQALSEGRELVGWDVSSLILVIGRLLAPSSEPFTAEQWYPKTALPVLLGVPIERVDDNRLYRTLDRLLPHKSQLEIYLKERMGELFDLESKKTLTKNEFPTRPSNSASPYNFQVSLSSRTGSWRHIYKGF